MLHLTDQGASGSGEPAEPKARDSFATGRLWSLWDMFNFNLRSILQFVKSVEVEVSRFRTYCDSGQGKTNLSDRDGSRMEIAIKATRELFSRTDSTKQISICINDLEEEIKRGGKNLDIFSKLSTLYRVILLNLDERFYYAYPIHKAAVFDKWKAEWEPVYCSFADTKHDIWHGVDCWAMGQDTASVFHMMRVLEHGLSWLASDVDLTMTIENWHTIIDQIEKKIRESADTLQKGVQKNERMQFLSEAAKEFRYFKDGWRNYVSHGRSVYDEHSARSVLDHVKSFMLSLAKQKSASL